MKFEELEESLDLGEPINLFLFVYGPEEEDFYAYTDAETPIVLEGTPYYPNVISRGDINSSGTTDKRTLEISLPSDDPVAEMFRVYPPSYPMAVWVYQGHVGAEDFALQWSGKVLSCSRDGSLGAALTCEPSSVSMQRVGLRRHYQYMCPHVLYGDQCKANKAAATITVIPSAVSGRLLTLNTLISNPSHYAGGILEWENSEGRLEYRTILQVQTVGGSTQFTLSGVLRGATVGAMMLASKGCAHNLSACGSVHNNIPNYGGQPFIPTKNPLGRSSPFL